jgi:murein tripeptide amidase MpaA
MPRASVRITSDFPCGRVEVVDARSPSDLRVAIPPDPEDTRFRQWFCFDVVDRRRRPRTLTIVNAGLCTWPRAFTGYDVCATDGEGWFRVPTRFDGERLVLSHEPAADRVRYAYFAPYEPDRLRGLAQRAAAGGATRRPVATSLLGAPLPLLGFGRRDRAAPTLWIVAQQHPGEHMAGWFMEGLVERLLSGDDTACALLEAASLKLVPCMNPDGVALGNHRTNAAGLDLNRQWELPDRRAPEVRGVRAAMKRRGVDLFLDVHGDEELPHVFAQGTDGLPSRSPRVAALEARFADAMLAATPDFQTEHGYPPDEPGAANMKIAANAVGAAFDCLSLTLEMPFIDHAEQPDVARGWSPERSVALGAAAVDALAACLPDLR